MPIPKIIHYCWFGPKPIPKLEKLCIESWEKFLPDYELKFWNEHSFDIEVNSFVREAYESKYYAFVSDYVRAWVLKKYGGIYLDTDYEILADFSNLIGDYDAILGFENSSLVGTAMMAFKPNHYIVNDFLNYYNQLSFLSSSGKAQITANPSILAEILIRYGFTLNGEKQLYNNVQIFQREIFFPKKISEKDFRVTEFTKGIHHFSGSWLTDRQKRRGQNIIWIEVCRPILKKSKDLISIIMGKTATKKIELQIRNWLK
jgi:mannosyltransferase OCH1-like enzyme